MVVPSQAVPTGRGLSTDEAARRLAADGPNVVVPDALGTRWRRWIGPIADPMVALLLVAAPTYLLIGETTDAIVAFVALGPIAAVGWLLEGRAERTLEQLRRLTAPTVVVVRDGRERSVPAREVVVGDLVVVTEGDVVPADAVLRASTQVLVDESSLTGESMPVDKEVDATGDAAALWAGTTVVSGSATIEVVATGAATRYGRIGRLLADVRPQTTPLQRSLARLVRALALVALTFCLAVIVAVLAHGDGWGAAVIAGVSLAIAAIPEEFSMVYTLYLALGAWRLAQDRALVRRLPSVETLGSTTVICTDKTGTLTEGRLAVTALWTPETGIEDADRRLTRATTDLWEAAVRACEPRPFDPLDLAIVDAARRHGVDVDDLHRHPLVADWPFVADDKYLTHAWLGSDRETGQPIRSVAAKGSIEGIIHHSSTGPDDDAIGANRSLTERGMRVIAVASGTAPTTTTTRDEDEAGLVLRGLIAFSDPVRDGVGDALAECRAAGIRVIMITGDHPTTAHAIAEGLQLPHEGPTGDLIATGDDLDAGRGLDELVVTTNVFARTRPEHKHLLVQALRRRGEVVAMTGDGVNDAPALREADIGVAMGVRGTVVAREAASIVLLDDNFATIVGAVRDGRRIFDNLVRAFAYLIAFHPPLLIGALVIPLLDRPLLLLPIHLVVLELLLHPIVSLVFQADPASPGTMRRPPRPVGDALRLRSLARPYAVGLVLALEVLAVYLIALRAWPEDEARALAFAALLASQPLLLLSMRSPDRPFWADDRPWTKTLAAVIVVLLCTTVAVVHIPPLADLLHLAPFPIGWWVVVAAVAATTLWSEPFKRSDLPRWSRR
jgi:Ca2+-transporting ATPase